MSFFWKLVDETQMSNPPEPAMHHYQIKLLILLPPETFTLDHSQMRHPVCINLCTFFFFSNLIFLFICNFFFRFFFIFFFCFLFLFLVFLHLKSINKQNSKNINIFSNNYFDFGSFFYLNWSRMAVGVTATVNPHQLFNT